ncbi:hypothetical protein [Microbacterium sp. XT11]|uniref:hypothetical protein n=1 Tax=Microbacterium sp. XT11 TaxID=367477 RepID=UPI00082B06B6|nr:hypothetical protein [Microbacterium sp. XT11]
MSILNVALSGKPYLLVSLDDAAKSVDFELRANPDEARELLAKTAQGVRIARRELRKVRRERRRLARLLKDDIARVEEYADAEEVASEEVPSK